MSVGEQTLFARGMKTPKTTLMLLPLGIFVSCSEPTDLNTNESESATVVEVHPAVDHLNRIVIPKVDITDATIEEAFDYVRHILLVHDKESDVTQKGVSMVIRGPMRKGDDVRDSDIGLDSSDGDKITRITYSAENVSYIDLVAEIARQAQMDVYLTSVGIIVLPEGLCPFPDPKADEGEIWKAIRQTQFQK